MLLSYARMGCAMHMQGRGEAEPIIISDKQFAKAMTDNTASETGRAQEVYEYQGEIVLHKHLLESNWCTDPRK